MNDWSKMLPAIEVMPCKTLAHPWTDSCLLSAVYTLGNSCVGSAGFYALLYLCQYMSWVIKKKRKVTFKNFLRTYLRSTIFGTLVATGTFTSHCLLRRVFGRYHYYTFVFAPAFIGGCSIFLESRRGQELCTNAFANCTLELWVRLLEQYKILKWNPNVQTIIFMCMSSLLSSLLSWTNFDSNYFWFFMPPKVNKNEDKKGICFHKNNCGRHTFNIFVMYFTTGLVLQFLGILTKNLTKPKIFLSSLKKPKAFKLAAFLGGYAVLYQVIRCYLYQKNKKYSLLHDSIAGFLAGVAFRFQPTIPIFNSAVITTVQILTEEAYQRKMLPNIPYLEIIFAFFCGVLFHSRILLSEHCPQVMVYITSAVTHGMSDMVTQNYRNILNNLMGTFSTGFED